VWEQRFVLEHLAEITAVDPAAAGPTVRAGKRPCGGAVGPR
jgi:hypothetical protein